MNWTKEQAIAAWRKTKDKGYDPNWQETICELLQGLVEMDVVIEILGITHAVGVYEYETAAADIQE